MASKLHEVSLVHLTTLMGPFGLYQHGEGLQPRLSEGYCVDDNARAVTVLLPILSYLDPSQRELAASYIKVCWQFVVDAQHGEGELYNFRTSEGVWLSHGISGDMYARVVRTCVTVIVIDTDMRRIEQARTLLNQILQHAEELFVVVRAYAEVLVALCELSRIEALSSRAQEVVDHCMVGLVDAWNMNASKEWPWFEDGMTYANALLSHGMLAALHLRSDGEIKNILQQSSKFLLTATISQEMFIPIGNSKWYYRNGERSVYDQQPIEAAVMLDFLADLAEYDKLAVSQQQLMAVYDWFFGKNSARLSLVETGSGACHDGLLDGAVNENCGAESLLSYLLAEVRIRDAQKLYLQS